MRTRLLPALLRLSTPAAAAPPAKPPAARGVPGTRFGEEVRPVTLGQAVLVRPGRAVTGEVACAGWGMPRRGTVAVSVAAPAWAEVRRAVRVPLVWSGVVGSGVIEVGKPR